MVIRLRLRGRPVRPCALLLFAASAPALALQNPAASQNALKTVSGGMNTVTDFENTVTDAMRMAGVTGLSVAIVNDGEVVYSKAFGWKNKDAGTLLDEETVFAAGSLSKPVFAYLILTLEDEGLIDLDRPLHEYLPKPLPDYQAYADLAMDTRYRNITARMVLSHTTGFPNLRSSTRHGRLRIEAEPGTRFSYSGEGFQLLQLVLETITGTDLETLAGRRVFVPLGMRRTSFVWQEVFATNVAAPHNQFEWAGASDRPPSANAAGSMITTARDYACLLALVMTEHDRLRARMERMVTPAVRITSTRMLQAGGAPPTSAGESSRLWWGLGWGVLDTDHGRAYFHTGHKGGAQNYAIGYRDSRIGIVVLSNSDNFESVAAEIVAAGIGDGDSPFEWLGYEPYDPARRRSAPPPRPVAVQVPVEVLASYGGEYQFESPRFTTYIKTEDGRLYASDDAQTWDELLAQSETVFFFSGRTLTLRFVTDSAGEVTGIQVRDGRTIMTARRVR